MIFHYSLFVIHFAEEYVSSLIRGHEEDGFRPGLAPAAELFRQPFPVKAQTGEVLIHHTPRADHHAGIARLFAGKAHLPGGDRLGFRDGITLSVPFVSSTA